MDRRKLLKVGGAAAVAAATAPAAALADSEQQGLVGSWFGTVVATDPPLGQFDELISFLEGGVAIESRRYEVTGTPFGTLLETTGHGAWKRTGRQYEAFFRFFLQAQETGAPVGTDNVRLRFRLASDTLSGTFQSQIKDLSDAVLLTVTGAYSARRIST